MSLIKKSQSSLKNRYSMAIMNGAGWHTSDIAEHFHHVSVIKLPPYSPELNPIEQVWSWLRQHYLANQGFIDDNDIVSKMCRAWNGFLTSTDRAMKQYSRDWIELTR
ncbi:transposase [Vibrio cincinnatiensis]|nr:transposase [Vibrio cincinnatiensis]